ncbi:MAG: O-methyltransferase [Bacteroidetes bacterium]|nr:O-methyltransferase [Bacteroidota bacterium]
MISEKLLEYAEVHTSKESPLLAKLNRETNLTQMYPRMLSGHVQGTLLRMISAMIKPLRILEIGTFTGYSAICLSEGLQKGGFLHTIEVNPEQEEIIRKYIAEAGLTDKIILHIGEAEKVISSLKEKWDLVFIDADKPNYLTYYNMVFNAVRSGGFILADNALWGGKVLDEKTTDKDARGIIRYNEFVLNDDRVENILLPIRDGLMISRKK